MRTRQSMSIGTPPSDEKGPTQGWSSGKTSGKLRGGPAAPGGAMPSGKESLGGDADEAAGADDRPGAREAARPIADDPPT